MSDTSASRIFRRFGYDPDDPVRGREIPDRLIDAIAAAPLIPEKQLGRVKTMAEARELRRVLDRRHRTL